MDDLGPHDPWGLRERVVIVTGAGRGLGRWISLGFARAGARLAIAARTRSQLEETAAEIRRLGTEVLPIVADVRDPVQCERLVEEAHRHYRQLDVLVNNAGTSIRRRALETTVDDFNTIVETNFRGTYFCAVAAGRIMVNQGSGAIVNVASTAALLVRRGVPNSVYGPAKAAVVMLTKALAEEWAAFGVRVNCVAPGRFPTDLIDRLSPPGSPEWSDVPQTIPMGRLGEPEDIVGPILFFASPASRYVTGQTLFVDGGRTVL